MGELDFSVKRLLPNVSPETSMDLSAILRKRACNDVTERSRLEE